MPTTKQTPARIARRRAALRKVVPRRVEASLGSSCTRARSICSSSRNSSSESGTGLRSIGVVKTITHEPGVSQV